MRICPECGHADPSWWRPRNSRVFCDFTKAETLEYNNPELFKKIKEAHPTFYSDGHYLYHITRTGLNVERIEKEYHDFNGIDWVVIGAKTGAHPFQPDNYWVSKLTIMAHRVGAKVFHKSNLWWPSEKNGPPFPIRQFPDEEWFEWRTSKLTEALK